MNAINEGKFKRCLPDCFIRFLPGLASSPPYPYFTPPVYSALKSFRETCIAEGLEMKCSDDGNLA